MKKVLAGLLAVLMVVTMLPVTAMADGLPEAKVANTTGEWKDNTYTISFSGGTDTEALAELAKITDDTTAKAYEVNTDKSGLTEATGVTVTFTPAVEDPKTAAKLELVFGQKPNLTTQTDYYIGITSGEPEATSYVKVMVTDTIPSIESIAITLDLTTKVEVGNKLPKATVDNKDIAIKTKWTNASGEELNIGDNDATAAAAGKYTATIIVESMSVSSKITTDTKFTINGKEATWNPKGGAVTPKEGALEVTVAEPVKEPTVLTPKVEPKDGADLSKTYDGTTTAPDGWQNKIAVSFTDSKSAPVSLTANTDYTLSAKYASAEGGAKLVVTITLQNKDYKFQDSQTANVTVDSEKAIINKASISEDDIEGSWGETSLVYNGANQSCVYELTTTASNLVVIGSPKVSTVAGDSTKTVAADTKNVGKYVTEYVKEGIKLTNEANKNYVLVLSDSFKLQQEWEITPSTITGTVAITADQTEIGNNTKLTASISGVSGVAANESPDYKYQWSKNGTEIGEATTNEYTITGGVTNDKYTVAITLDNPNYKLNLTPAQPVTFGSTALSDVNVTVSGDTLAYDGTEKKPTVTVKVGPDESAVTLKEGTDYTVTYGNNINAGTNTASVIVSGIGSYSGTVTKTFSIGKATPTISDSEIVVNNGLMGSTIITVDTDGKVTATSANTDVARASASDDNSLVYIGCFGAGDTTVTITAGEGSNYSAKTFTVSVKSVIYLPGNPILTATPGNGSVTLSWTISDENNVVNGYNVYVNEQKINEDPISYNLKTTTIDGLTNGTEYKFKIEALYRGGEGLVTSNEVKATPKASSSGGGSTGGGSTGGGSTGGSTGPTPPTPSDTKPSETVQPSVAPDGSVTGKVDSSVINNLIGKADSNTSEVVVDVKAPAGADEVKAELPASSLKDLADKTNADLTVSTPVTDVTLTQDTLKELGNAEGTVTVTATQKDTGTTTAPSTNITVSVEQGGKEVAAGVTATVPSKVMDDMAAKDNSSVSVTTPVAEVTLPKDSLSQLKGSDVTVSTSKSGNATTVEVQKNGSTVNDVDMKVSLPVGDKEGDGTVAFIVVDGKETLMPKSIVDDGNISVMLNTGKATIVYKDNSKTFNDSSKIPGWAKADFASSRGLIVGTVDKDGTTSFSPNKATTRAQLVAMLHRLESEPSAGNASFDDVSGNSWFAEAAAWGKQVGIVAGTGSGFQGNRDISRQEMVMMLYQYMNKVTGIKGSSKDYSSLGGANQVGSWASDAMSWAYGSGIISGKATSSGTNLAPRDTATRAEVSAILERFVKLIAK